MASHRRERAVRFRDMVQEAENQSTSDQAASSNAEGVVGDEHGPYQESGARQNMQPPPPPTLLQLQRLLNIRREANVVESSQETESLHPTVDLSQPPDDEVASNDNEQYATPRMPSPSLQGLQLTLESLPVRGKVVDFNGETSHHGVRPSRKHRMSDDEEEAEYTNMIPATESSKGTREDSTNKRPCTNSNPQDVAEGEAGNQVIVCIFTGLGKDQRALFDQNIARVIEAGLLMEHIQDQTFSVTTSHIITNADADASKRTGLWLCPRMLKYLHGMLSEPWIVRHEWFVDSIDAKAWLPLPDSNYLIQGDTQFGPAPGTQKRREIRSRKTLKLFASCRVFFYGSFGTSFTKDELMRLVRDGGAETLHRRPTAKQPTLPPSTPPLIGMSTKSMPSAMEFFAPDRSFLYVSEDTEPWKVPLDKTVPIIVCDPTSIPSGPISGLSAAHSRKHGWLCDHQAVSLTWLLNCISCSLMGVQDIELLYGSSDERDSEFGNEEIRQLSQAWNSWRDKK
ncbi:BRCA1-associated RING domain protein 1 [Mortierella sp. GBA43]|nr:BRCA1-associated RING domain protein 1 [Mortierella sp. GBA43]